MLILTDIQKCTLTIDPRNAKGTPAQLDGVPEWATTNPAVASIAPAADGLSAVVVALSVGTAQINVSADADLDPGETRTLTGVLDVDVRASEAVTLGISTGTPEDQ